MRRILAIILVVAGAALLVIGQLGSTIWAPPAEHRATVALDDPGSAVLIDPGVVYMGGTDGKLEITGNTPVSVIPASPADAKAYLGKARYTRITGASDWSTLTTAVENPKGDPSIPDPTKADLFRAPLVKPADTATVDIAHLDEREGKGARADARPYEALLVVADGTKPAASTVTIEWPNDAANRWVPYMFATGAVIAVIGAVLLLIDFQARRRQDEEDA